MNSLKKRIIVLTAFSALLVSLCGNLFAEDLPHGYKNIVLGMSLEETKENLIKDPDFGYHGDRDVSLIPHSSKTYYSIFTKLVEKYGEPTSFDPQSATWKNDEVTMSLEKPLTLKYIDNKRYEETQNYSNIEASPTEITREMFLEEL